MTAYEIKARYELRRWISRMAKRPSYLSIAAKDLQSKFNGLIPEKAQIVMTDIIKFMVKIVLAGSEYFKQQNLYRSTLKEKEALVYEKAKYYKRAAATGGAWTGAGGIILSVADLPILLSLKIKFLFDVASIYGFDTSDYKERLYILYIFKLAFSSKVKQSDIFFMILHWDKKVQELPDNVDFFDWKTFQQDYRDYIDLAKLLQMVPGIGAFVGAYTNYKLLDKLAETAINAYRLRLFDK